MHTTFKKIMRTILYLIFSILITFELAAQVEIKSKDFKKYQRNCSVDFQIPVGFSEKKVKKLPNLKYDLNLVSDTGDFCIRYTFYDGEMATDYVYNSFNRLNLMNLTQMDSTATIYKYVQNDSLLTTTLNVDKAGYTIFDIKSGYGKGYKYCNMIFAHKRNIANLYVTILFNTTNEDLRNHLFNQAINSISFKND